MAVVRVSGWLLWGREGSPYLRDGLGLWGRQQEALGRGPFSDKMNLYALEMSYRTLLSWKSGKQHQIWKTTHPNPEKSRFVLGP